MSKKNNWVSASQVGRAAYCPHYLELQQQGKSVSSQAQSARIKGEQKHDQLNQRAIKDTRCYIASHLYGVEDSRTCLLRTYRDQALLPYLPGRILVHAYYAGSPVLVRLAKRYPLLDVAIRKVIDRIVDHVKRTAGGHDV